MDCDVTESSAECVVIEQTTTQASYVVPMYSLVAFLYNTDKPETIHTSVVELMQKIENNQDVKIVLGEMSSKLTEIVNKIDPNFIATIIIPNVFIPIKEERDSNIVTGFVDELNKALAIQIEKDNQK
jgi:hypothetical protein